MATGSMDRVIQGLRRAALIQDGVGASDAELLTCFIERRDEASFETLLRRHGPMVLGVCRRVLGNHHDAKDMPGTSADALAGPSRQRDPTYS